LFCLFFVENRKKQSGGKAPHSKNERNKAAAKRRTPKMAKLAG